MPASRMAAILSDALPAPAGDDGAGVPHAASGGRGLAGHESHHRLLHVGFHVGRGGLLGVAADFADHHDGVRLGVFVEQLRASTKLVPMMGSPPMPMQVDWPMPSLVNWPTAS